MAEVFQRVIQDSTASYATMYTCPASTTAIIIGCQAANTDTSAHPFSIKSVTSGGGSEAILANEVSIPANDALNPIQGKLVLEAGDYVQIDSDGTSVEVTMSILELS